MAGQQKTALITGITGQDGSYLAELLLDKGTSTRHFQDIVPHDFLGFNAKKAYKEQIIEAINKTGESDAINVYDGNINDHQVVLGIMNFKFIGGSMGSVVGEIVSRALIMAGEKNVPFILICSSGS